MRRRLAAAFCGLTALAAAAALLWPRSQDAPSPYPRPLVGAQTLFPARVAPGRTLTIEAATDVSFMRPFIDEFQRRYPQVAVQYVDTLSSELLQRARRSCARENATPDLYLTISTDHLVELANGGCASPAPRKVAAVTPAWAQWRREVMAFSVEPAVFVYDRRRVPEAKAPRSHLALVEALRADPQAWAGRIGTYDIERSGPGYNYASFDARQAAIYGRLIESFGRSRVKIYCCSNDMVEAVAQGDITLAYNVQLSYAYAGQRAGLNIGVVLPSDYQAIQTRSVMITRDARNPVDAAAFVGLLASPRGQALAAAQITPPHGAMTLGKVLDTERASQVVVDSSLLALRDAGRRESFISDWRAAVRPPGEDGA